MNFDQIWTAFYSQFRADADVPASTDDEYTVGVTLANEAINRWSRYDGTLWDDLYDTNQNDGSGSQTITTADTSYAAPTNFLNSGGFIKVLDSSGNIAQKYPIIKPNQVQFKGDTEAYAYFTRSPLFYNIGTASQSATTITGSGTTWTSAMIGMQFLFVTGETATITAFTSTTSLTASVSQTVASAAYRILTAKYQLNVNPAPTATLNGMDIDYLYYKEPLTYTAGASITEISDPYFVVHRMLASQFRAARNPYYSSAKTDAENALKQLQIKNNSGDWADTPELADNSGMQWGS